MLRVTLAVSFATVIALGGEVDEKPSTLASSLPSLSATGTASVTVLPLSEAVIRFSSNESGPETSLSGGSRSPLLGWVQPMATRVSPARAAWQTEHREPLSAPG